ncbi:glycosyltransferase family 2 protein [Sphingomonas glaciei]|uniref:Glycosyltransferase family 2 protein n=1 Tax=Sphingomonas glaciei TaxID=2938948 RepID=A0ABY5N0E9_9SPHN|nr:glycosyltransferase family 2 protein [Sphingomonas glaciei]UUR08086.1 glycosyltransferase family 2 protein [Sphingomonas glaciei]
MRARLLVRVHWDGFRASPRDYLQAAWWRLRGLRLRSRHKLSSLIGRSPRAYDLWRLREPAVGTGTAPGPEMVALVDCRASLDGIVRSLASIEAAGLRPVILGEPPAGFEGAIIREPSGLSGLVPASGSMLLIAICPGDRISPDARQRYWEVLGDSDRLLYADDDRVDQSGHRSDPHFKPDWNAELFRHHDYLSGASLMRVSREELARLPGDGWNEALIASLLASGVRPKHVPTILHHRSTRPAPHIPGRAVAAPVGGYPLVSVIVPTRNQAPLLRACVEGLGRTDYPAVELIVVDNGSDEEDALALLDELRATGAEVLRRPGPFNFSALVNAGARHAGGKLLCLLNNDIEVLAPDWLRILATQALRGDVGAVGARLLYPDHSLQHAGVVIGLGGGAGHAHRFEAVTERGYFYRTHLPQFVSAVTAACLMVDRDRFWAVDGLDEQHFPVAFNDVDFCLRLNARGWQSFYEPRATLIHHESKSRGKDSDPANRERFARELAELKRRWNTDRAADPFHNPNLSRFSERFVVDL